MPARAAPSLASSAAGPAERSLILWLAREPPREEPPPHPLADVDFGALAEELLRLRLLGLLGGRLLTRAPGDQVDPAFRQTVERLLAASRRDGVRKQMITWQITSQLERTGIPAMPLKGPFLAERLYGDAGLRVSHDIDILVAPRDMPGAVRVLEGMGYVRPLPGERLPLLHHGFVMGDGPPVELHWRTQWYETTYSGALLARSRLDGDVRAPAPEDELVLLLLFHARDGLIGLRYPVDIATCWRRLIASGRPPDLAPVLRDHPPLRRPVTAAMLAVDAVLELAVGGDRRPAARPSRRIRAAVGLARWSATASEGEIDVTSRVVDGLLTDPAGLPRFIRRAMFPRLPGRALTRPFRQLGYAAYFIRRATPLIAEQLRAAGRTDQPGLSGRAARTVI